MAHVRSLFLGGPLAAAEDAALAALGCGRPSHVIWNVTDRCNLKCRHCYMGATGATADGELSTKEALALVNWIADVGTPLLFLTGGEMFTRRDIWEILEAADARDLRLVVSTNGTLIDRSDIRRLKGLGVDYAAVSIYGPRDFHDGYVLVPGTFDRTIETACILREEGIGIAVKTVVNTDTWPHLPEIVQTCKDIGAGVLYACDLITTGRASDMGTRAVGPVEWREFADRIVGEILADPDGLEFDIGAQPSVIPYIASRLAEHGHDVSAVYERLARMTACPVGHGHMTINAKGDIMPCSFMQNYSVGNVRDTSLAEAARVLFDLGHEEIAGDCAGCESVEICRGCRAKAHCASGDILGGDPACMMADERSGA